MNIELVNLWYKYPPNKIALKNISFNIKNSIVVIIGPNASGKTTLLKLISLIYKPWKGKILVDRKDYWGLSRREQLFIRRRIVYVHEKPVFVRGTILDNLLLGFRIRGVNISREDLANKISELLEVFGLNNMLSLKPSVLSAGQLQLISIIRALLLEPELLVLDEPTANLDNEKRKVLLEYLEEYVGKNDKRKIIIATHDLFIPIMLRDTYIIVLDNGEVIEKGSAHEVLEYEYKKLYSILKNKYTVYENY